MVNSMYGKQCLNKHSIVGEISVFFRPKNDAKQQHFRKQSLSVSELSEGGGVDPKEPSQLLPYAEGFHGKNHEIIFLTVCLRRGMAW